MSSRGRTPNRGRPWGSATFVSNGTRRPRRSRARTCRPRLASRRVPGRNSRQPPRSRALSLRGSRTPTTATLSWWTRLIAAGARSRRCRRRGPRLCHGAPANSAPVDHASRASWGRTARLPPALQPPPHLLTTLPVPAGGGRRVCHCRGGQGRPGRAARSAAPKDARLCLSCGPPALRREPARTRKVRFQAAATGRRGGRTVRPAKVGGEGRILERPAVEGGPRRCGRGDPDPRGPKPAAAVSRAQALDTGATGSTVPAHHREGLRATWSGPSARSNASGI